MIKQLGSLVVVCLALAGCSSSAPPAEPEWPESAPLERGLEAYQEGHYQQALRLLARAQHEFKLSDARAGLLVTHLNLAEVLLRLERPAAAGEHIAEAAALSHELDHQEAGTRVALQRVRQLLLQESYGQAERVLSEYWPAASLQDRAAHNGYSLAALQLSTQLALAVGDLPAAEQWLEVLEQATEAEPATATGRLHRARYLRLQADYGQATGQAAAEVRAGREAALQWYRESEHRPGIGATLAELAYFYQRQGRAEQANDYARRASYIFAWSGQEAALERMQAIQRAMPAATIKDL